jgi:uncharacterized membrane protein YhfC
MSLIPGIGMIIVGVTFIIFWKRKTILSFKPFLWGALLWIIGVSLKFAVAIPINQRFLKYLLVSLHPFQAEFIYYTYVGLLTGVFECAICYLVIKYTFLRNYEFDKIMAFGIGFGAIEAILLGIYFLFQILVRWGYPQTDSLLILPAPIVERLFIVVIHIYCSVLIFYSTKRSKISYFLVSFFLKTLVDGLAAWYILGIAHSITNTWIVEAGFAVFGILSLYGLYRIINIEKPNQDSDPSTTIIISAV